MDSNDYIKDVEFEEVDNSQKNEKHIRGKVLYYSTSQVAIMLNEKDSKIRYYTKFFDDMLNIEVSNAQRQYTEQDVEKLRYIINLKNEGMTLKQIKEYCQEVDFHKKELSLKESNPLPIQALAKALMDEQAKQIEALKEDLFEKMTEFILQQKESQEKSLELTREEIVLAVDEVVEEKLNNSIAEIKDSLKMSYVTKDEIKKLSSKGNWFKRLLKK